MLARDDQLKNKKQYPETIYEMNSIFRIFGFGEMTESSVELLIRHPLQSRWALWYLKADRNKEWEDCLKVNSSMWSQ
uniref:Ovule protein n=1 Tax=Heterorhabditis bacteriophora TaxID=37862 RepID=A0A1I7WQ62_HETBA